MCTETFLRLPAEKRLRFLDAAWEEFGRVKFQDVSINQIIRRAGIPRGSFYQYFAGKEDLFDYLLEDVKAKFVEVFRQSLDLSAGNVFQATLGVFDLITRQPYGENPMLNRCFRILEHNPGLDLRRLVAGQMAQDLPPELLEKLDVSQLRHRDPAALRRVFLMAIFPLGGVLMGSFLCPDQTENNRRELEAQLDIIQYGSIRPSAEAT